MSTSTLAVVDGAGLSPHYQAVARYPLSAPLNRRFEFSPSASEDADVLVSSGARAVYAALVLQHESEGVALAALRVLNAVLETTGSLNPSAAGLADELIMEAGRVRAALEPAIAQLSALRGGRLADVLRERAPLALLAECWLDSVSQAATQPAAVANRLFEQHFSNHGGGDPRAAKDRARRRRLEDLGVPLGHLMDTEFLDQTGAHEVTAWHGAFYLALSRYGASFLPEVVGAHCAHRLLGIDDRLLGLPETTAEEDTAALLREFLDFAAGPDGDPRLCQQLVAGFEAVLVLETEHVGVLREVLEYAETASLDSKVAEMLARHAPYAGRQHRNVRIGGELLTEMLDEGNFDAVEFMRSLRASRQVKPMGDGDARLLKAIRFGGPMFGIFDDGEAALLVDWVAEIQRGVERDPNPLVDRVGSDAAARWQRRVDAVTVPGLSFGDSGQLTDREFLHRLVNVERYPSVLAAARDHAGEILERARLLFEHGAAGRYTDASYFDYSAEALNQRVETIYFDKLVTPYRPLAAIASLDEVVFGQKTFALGSLIDGTWAHRIGRVGRFDEVADQMLWGIYADEMGRGDLRKNHITLIYRTLASMGIELPHLADPAFRDQAELPDSLYGFSLHQLSLSLFADSMREEILGYNLGIEMFGLGEMRMHEMQKLRHYGFDDCYEAAHLSIDNVSAGHARQSANIIIAHLDRVSRLSGPEAVQRQWQRVWNGYASFAYFIEHALIRSVQRTQPATEDLAELTI